MQCAERLPLAATRDEPSPRVPLAVDSWNALARMHDRLRQAGRVVEATLSYLGNCGIDRYELRARVVDAQGMIDDRIWLLERAEVEAWVATLDDGSDARGFAHLVSQAARPA